MLVLARVRSRPAVTHYQVTRVLDGTGATAPVLAKQLRKTGTKITRPHQALWENAGKTKLRNCLAKPVKVEDKSSNSASASKQERRNDIRQAQLNEYNN